MVGVCLPLLASHCECQECKYQSTNVYQLPAAWGRILSYCLPKDTGLKEALKSIMLPLSLKLNLPVSCSFKHLREAFQVSEEQLERDESHLFFSLPLLKNILEALSILSNGFERHRSSSFTLCPIRFLEVLNFELSFKVEMDGGRGEHSWQNHLRSIELTHNNFIW